MFVTKFGSAVRSQKSVQGKSAARNRRKERDDCPSLCTLQTTPIIDALSDLFSQAPMGSTGSYLFKYEYQAQNFKSKFVGSDGASKTPLQRENAAIEKMLASERVCHDINEFGYRPHLVPDWFEGVMLSAQAYCARVLGDIDYSMFEHARFTGGASTSRRRSNSDIAEKYDPTVAIDVTSRALPYGNALIRSTPSWDEYAKGRSINIVTGNRITTVPKNTEIDRCIAMEPDLNMSLQLAVGKHIRSGLKRHCGININDQSINQVLACVGSLDGSLATIDLSSASDSISNRIVWDLLPPDWFQLLDVLRSHSGSLPNGKTMTWQKFSSMGNGFTFELETLIFAALCYGVGKQADCALTPQENFHVYGDDIIVPTEIASNVISALYTVGFSCNEDKTFTTGLFRESCGKHYYTGDDVSPFYLRAEITTIDKVCWLANRFRSWCTGENGELTTESDDCYQLWKTIRNLAPSRLYGGCDVSSTRYVVTLSQARSMLVVKTAKKPLKGLPCLFRWFQGKTYSSVIQGSFSTSHGEMHWSEVSTLGGLAQGQHKLLVRPSAFSFKENTEMWSPVKPFVNELLH